ncbi:DgyrCDS1110 [Dimorphilus gyrociliatus]|uniref:DgyrCDS1110 n=1 Tax=Dimorphilus gyrociliatus TaxID=2664684 RepID=A0A7I8V6M3_9ANNE|nr:DgyrCDS1110 [Dimorphilus gyrociliatus]
MDFSKTANANMKFGLKLWREMVNEKADENIFFSPFSISTALAMVHLGARGATQKQIGEVLEIDSIPDDYKNLAALSTEILSTNREGCSLTSASRLFAGKDYSFLDNFMANTKSFFNAESETMDFVQNLEGARQAINSWVANQTNDKIKDFLSQGSINVDTAMVLINAIHFKGDWLSAFNPKDTFDDTFYINDKEKVPVKMMFMTKPLRVGFDSKYDVQLLELPYKGNEISMIIMLPRCTGGHVTLEREIDEKILNTMVHSLRVENVEIYLPKFKVSFEQKFIPTLKNLGMVDAFEINKADFSGMNGRQDLYLSEILQKSFIEVNEEGTEAAAATGIEFQCLATRISRQDDDRRHCTNILILVLSCGSDYSYDNRFSLLRIGSTYKLLIKNAHDHICICHIRIDEKDVGSFLMNPCTQFVLARPVDTPLAFQFSKPLPHCSPDKRSGSKVECFFFPEVGANLLKVEVTDEEKNINRQMELSIDWTSDEIFTQIKRGAEDLTQHCLIVWTINESDSSIDFILTDKKSIPLLHIRRRDQKIRKLSMLSFKVLKVRIGSSEPYLMELEDGLASFSHVTLLTNKHMQTNCSVYYFLAPSGRYIGSTEWIPDSMPVAHLLHRNEILPHLPTVGVRVLSDKPTNLLNIQIKIIDSSTYNITVSGQSTIRDCKLQVSILGGPDLSSASGWLYCGQVLDDEFTLDYYGIRNRDFIDVIIRKKKRMGLDVIQTKDPIAVDRKLLSCMSSRFFDEKTLKRSNSHKGWTILRGLIRQQFITVDPIEIDERFTVKKQLFILPFDQ